MLIDKYEGVVIEQLDGISTLIFKDVEGEEYLGSYDSTELNDKGIFQGDGFICYVYDDPSSQDLIKLEFEIYSKNSNRTLEEIESLKKTLEGIDDES